LHWLPHLNERPIDSIRYSELEALLASLPLTTAKTRNNTLIPLRGVFEFARRDRRITDNPAALLQNSPVQITPPDPLTLTEMNAILADMAHHYPIAVGDYFETALTTGLRPSELIAVEWRDFNENSRELRIQRARVWGKDKPKTKTNTVRDIELTDRAFAVIVRQKPRTHAAGGAIFWNPNTGKPWADEQVQRRYWNATLRRLGIRHRDAYQTRHTFATLTIMDGVNAVWVGRQMGHASLRMTLDVYAKWIDKADRGRERDKASMAFRRTEVTGRGVSKTRTR
jgi:integrase